MALSNEKPRLSRQFMYARFRDLNFPLADADVHRLALMDAGQEPSEQDWLDALKVTEGHSLYKPDVGDALALMVGPGRGDLVDTYDLPVGVYQVWSDTSTPASDERVVEVHGTITVVSA
jgi:hypothetical protein